MEPVGAGREHGDKTILPPLAGAGVLHGERAVTNQRLDPRPLTSRRDLGPQVPPGLPARRSIAPRLRQHSAPTQHPTPGARSLGRTLKLHAAYAIAQL